VKFTLHIWRQEGPSAPGRIETFAVDDVRPDMSFLELLDQLNLRLEQAGRAPIEFDYDCREGICGTCSLVINGEPHGPRAAATSCQIYMRDFTASQEIWVEPFRAGPFSVIKDLVVDRGALDRITQAGGFITAKAGSAPDANAILVPKHQADAAFDAAKCIGCGACAAACPNGSAMLFLAAKVAHFAHLPQGQPERDTRALDMLAAHDREGFGGCTNHGPCATACPAEISLRFIAELNRDFLLASLRRRPALAANAE
jgi:succinate dehydrogenase / fumarate reductase iron-sulfur subunit